MEAGPTDAEGERGRGSLVTGDANAARPNPQACDSVALRSAWRTSATRREKEKARSLLIRVTEQTTMRITPVLGVEIVHARTLGRTHRPCLNIPGNYT